MNKCVEHKGYYIEHDVYNANEWTIQYCSDDLIFNTLEEARDFIDEVEC